MTVPDIHQQEWKALLLDKIRPKLSSLSLKLKVNSLQMKLKKKQLSIAEAVQIIHQYCSTNPKIYAKDIQAIFKSSKETIK